MKHEHRTLALVLLGIAVLLAVDLVEKPTSTVHVALELGATLIAALAFLWLWANHIRRVFT